MPCAFEVTDIAELITAGVDATVDEVHSFSTSDTVTAMPVAAEGDADDRVTVNVGIVGSDIVICACSTLKTWEYLCFFL